MSAIFGILNIDGTAVEKKDLERMSVVLAHRGRDRSRLWLDGPIGLGHGLMRITREDRFEAQPLRDPDAGIVLTADLRLDNREELAAAFGIPEAELLRLPDSALLLRAFQTWGEGCAEHLLGDFAFAIWDAPRRRLLLGRDHMGQRSCFFHRGKRLFVFASEIKALWTHPEVPRAVTDTGIARMLMHDMSPLDGATQFKGIEGMLGATVVTIDCDGNSSRRGYWEPHADPSHEGRDETYYIDTYRAVLSEAVACRTKRTTAPVGLLLSGGYDSSAIAALAGPIARANGRKLVAVCSAMAADYHGTIRHARQWVEMCRRDMPDLDVRYVTREGKTVLSGLERSFAEDDGGTGAYHFVLREMYQAAAAADVRVIMDGYGGDQTLNPRGQSALAWLIATGRLTRFAAEFRDHMRMTGESFGQTLRRDVLAILLPRRVMNAWRHIRHGPFPAWRDQPVRPEFARQMIAAGVIDTRALRTTMHSGTDVRGQMHEAFRRRLGKTQSTALAAAHGLEPTHPFYDKRVVELALAIPPDLHVKHGRNRYLACRALADLYPAEFQTRWRRNDDQIPDFQRMASVAEPEVLQELGRMERSEALTRYVDFKKIRQLLAARGPDDHNSGWEEETQVALGAFVTARFIKWFEGHNR